MSRFIIIALVVIGSGVGRSYAEPRTSQPTPAATPTAAPETVAPPAGVPSSQGGAARAASEVPPRGQAATTRPPAAQEARDVMPTLQQAQPATVALKDDIVVRLAGYDAWAARHPGDAQNLVLYINGYPVRKLVPRPYEGEFVHLKLVRHAESRTEWAELLGRPSLSPRSAVIRIGVPGRAPFEGSATVALRTLDRSYLVIAGTAFAGLLVGFVLVSRSSDLLREGPREIGAADRRPFSLGRTQMAIWFFIVVASFLFIWIVTGAYDPLTGSVLGLIGISAGTALGAMVIDNNKDAAIDNRDNALRHERLRIDADVAALQTTIAQTQLQRAAAPAGVDLAALDLRITERQAEVAARTIRAQQIDDELRAIARSVHPPRSDGFWKDLLSDENGVSFHRFQVVVWTLVLAVIFAYTVYESLAMPEFDPKLLALMGLSSGTYLGFKFPEGK